MAARIRIDDWELDDDNLAELAVHGITAEIFQQVAEEAPRYRRNKKHRAATHQLVGPDYGGGFWVVCIVETHRRYVWRPVTGWKAHDKDVRWYRREGHATETGDDEKETADGEGVGG